MMNKNKQNIKLIPELRFPEFENDGEWVEKKLGEVAFITTGNSNREDSLKEGGNYTFFDRSEDIRTSNKYLFDTEAIIVGGEGQKFIPKYFIGKFDLHQRAYAIMNFEDKTIGKFLYYSIYNNRHYLLRYAVGSTVKSLRLPIFEKMPILLPKEKEQQKIASFLSNLDELIDAHKQKLALLKQHKKGLMQNLFPSENDELSMVNGELKKVPKLRFPEFKNSGEWVFLLGNELFQSVSNKNHNSDLQILAITQEYGAIPRDEIDYTVTASKQSIKNYKVVEIGDFIISLRSFQGGIEYSNYKGICSPAYIILRKKKELCNLFFKYFFKTDLYIRNLNKNLEGIRDGKMISYKQFSEIFLPYPSLPEQQKIAECLLSVDELIMAQAEKIEQLEKHKKGLMQKMFPEIN